VRPVLEYDVALATAVSIWVQGPPEEAARSILNPFSFLELSCQVRLIWLVETAVAVRLLGALTPARTSEEPRIRRTNEKILIRKLFVFILCTSLYDELFSYL
jgi:hypothetical protein